MKNRSKMIPYDQKTVANFGIAIHGIWISAIHAEMTSCVDTYALREKEIVELLEIPTILTAIAAAPSDYVVTIIP
ncbi:hypothetical protein [Methyloglobulus sp.]|uniref:hypothetical protein n=1 Tax=Methyloglobulus sp. TaxID=2518622 RepID=UPI0039894E7D